MISKELLSLCAAEFGVLLDDEQLSKFSLYAEILSEYNKKVNLTAIVDSEEIVVKHFADSLAVRKFQTLPPFSSLADVGTGAGFPGVPILISDSTLDVTLFDAVNKKLDFLRFLVKELDLKANIVHMRAEDAGRDNVYRETFDFVTARAVAQLRILSEYCLPLLKVGGKFIAMKGVISQEERSAGYPAVKILGGEVEKNQFYTIHNGDERNVIIVKKCSHTPPKYPRNMGQIKKNPL